MQLKPLPHQPSLQTGFETLTKPQNLENLLVQHQNVLDLGGEDSPLQTGVDAKQYWAERAIQSAIVHALESADRATQTKIPATPLQGYLKQATQADQAKAAQSSKNHPQS